MLRFNNRLNSILIFLLIAGCSPVRHSFTHKDNLSPKLFNSVTNPSKKSNYLFKSESIELFRCVFREQQFENENVVDITILNDSSKENKVTYNGFLGYWQEIYLFKIPATDSAQDRFIYFSTRFKLRANEVTGIFDTLCIGFGPSYFGRLTQRKGEYLIVFDTRLKPSKKCDHFELVKKGKSEMMFVLDKYSDKKKNITVSKIVLGEKNKIGGKKVLVYVTETIFNDADALNFHYIKSFK